MNHILIVLFHIYCGGAARLYTKLTIMYFSPAQPYAQQRQCWHKLKIQILLKVTYLKIWMSPMTSQQPTSPHTFWVPISRNTSTYSNTESQVRILCSEMDLDKIEPFSTRRRRQQQTGLFFHVCTYPGCERSNVRKHNRDCKDSSCFLKGDVWFKFFAAVFAFKDSFFKTCMALDHLWTRCSPQWGHAWALCAECRH